MLKKPKLLIYRGIGGIGDAVCCIPGIYKYIEGNKELIDITVAFPKYCLPVFKGIIENIIPSEKINFKDYQQVIDLGNPCPAAVYESKNRQDVKLSRVQLFAQALGLDPFKFGTPYYRLLPKDMEYIRTLKIMRSGYNIGIGLHSTEEYRNYPHMLELINRVTEIADHVFLFGEKLPEGYVKHPKHIQVIKADLRRAIATQVACSIFITVDTLFLHTAAALEIPTILLEGPLSNDYRFSGYPVIRIKSGWSCIPCWRNGTEVCRQSKGDISSCMEDITVDSIMERLPKKK